MPAAPSTPEPARVPGSRYEVTPLELFFDLVFVFAVSQLSHHLLAHLTWRGALETAVLLRAVFTVWFTTSWSATLVPVDQPRTQWMLLGVMLLGLFMNAAVTRAFAAGTAWLFVVPFLACQLGRTVWTLMYAPDPVFRDHYVRTLLWFLAISPLWLLGAAADPRSRLLWWATAAGLDLLGSSLAHPIPGRKLQSEHLEFDADHMLERCRLFLIIALGETVLTTGTAVGATPMSPATVITGTFALLGAVALWSLSFGPSGWLVQQHLEETTDPVRASRHGVTTLMVMVAGLIAVAVANREVIARPYGHPSATLTLLLFGGPVLFLAAQGWYYWAVMRHSPRIRVAGSTALALLGCVALLAQPYLALILSGAGLLLMSVVERRCLPAFKTA